MKASLQKIYNIFKLEAANGFDNRAVIGGLDRICNTWEAEARDDKLPEELLVIIATNLRDYPHLSTGSRKDVLEGLWRRIQKETGINLELDFSKVKEFKPASQDKPHQKAGTISSGKIVPKKSTLQSSEKPISLSTPNELITALDAPVNVLAGVGERHAQTLAKLGIRTLRNLLYFFPRRYDDYSQLKPINRLNYGDEVTIIGTLDSLGHRRVREGKTELIEAILNDGTGALRITWFNQPWIAKRLQVGTQYAISGKIDQYLGRLHISNPEPEPIDQQMLTSGRIVPVYPLTEQITQRWLRKLIHQVVNYWALRIQDHLPDTIRNNENLLHLSDALQQIHYPDNFEKLKAARNRLAFDELFLLAFGILQQKKHWQNRSGRIFVPPTGWIDSIKKLLPYSLTNAQNRTLDEILQDFGSGHPMNRLLQGDVGSGKTIIAAIASILVCQQNAQVALMAPTSILAEQHYQYLRHLIANIRAAIIETPPEFVLREENIALLIGSTTEGEKQKIREKLINGEIKLLIGTHALIESPINFSDLQLVIIDEQHRFGVSQRSTLREKGENPHLLVMTATPIPRSLALTIYGDLDLSIIDELPPNRQVVSTYILKPGDRERAYNLIRREVEEGKQAFIIYPLVEEKETSEAKAAVEEYQRLKNEIFPHLQIGLLHGRMTPDDKEIIMECFRNGEFSILVSTTVVEVGVDIPNASVMLIEGANRFGLAQLHQLRGRVGRGGAKAYCLLIPQDFLDSENERLSVMASTNDGFILAQQDLEQRGPGQFLGLRQAGFSELKFANLMDILLIEKARKQAQELLANDPDLSQNQYKHLGQELASFWDGGKGDIS